LKQCLGKFLIVAGEDCNNCRFRLKCYMKFKEQERLEEKLSSKQQIDWYKMPCSTDSLSCPCS